MNSAKILGTVALAGVVAAGVVLLRQKPEKPAQETIKCPIDGEEIPACCCPLNK